MNNWMVLSILLLLLPSGFASTGKNCIPNPHDTSPPVIQIAILLDTSGSMEGLIEQAKTQLWKMVNELISCRQNGIAPHIQVALYEYGKNSIPATQGYLRMILPLTADLDKVSEELFALRTNGGDEYCGQVIQDAVQNLSWSESRDDLKVIFIAGNEPFTQGRVDYRLACKAALIKGTIVNTIHCGPFDQGVAGMWQDGALRGEGKYMNIDQDQQLVHIDAPQDEKIIRLNQELNNTYIPYGQRGDEGKNRQMAQDSNAQGKAAESLSYRASFKSSSNYSNSGWDLVDAIKEDAIKLEKLDDGMLPKDMQGLDLKEKRAYVDSRLQTRVKVQARIKELSAKREIYILEKRKEFAGSTENTLDEAIIKIIREQAGKKGFVK